MIESKRYLADARVRGSRVTGLLWICVGAAVIFLGLAGSFASIMLYVVSATIIGGPFILYYGYRMYKRESIMNDAELKDEATFRYLESNDGKYVVFEYVNLEDKSKRMQLQDSRKK